MPKNTEHAIFFTDESRTKQSFKDESDINLILRKYEKTGLVDHVNRFRGDYTDLTQVQDYHTSMNQIIAAKEAFASLPSGIRNRFANDPAQFVEFVSDENNRDEMQKMGLLEEPQKPTKAVEDEGPPKEPVVPETTPQPDLPGA